MSSRLGSAAGFGAGGLTAGEAGTTGAVAGTGKGLAGAGGEAQVVFQMGIAGILDQHAVTIEEDGGNAGCHDARAYGAVRGRCNPSREVTRRDLAGRRTIW